jgi:hypothetical protein
LGASPGVRVEARRLPTAAAESAPVHCQTGRLD